MGNKPLEIDLAAIIVKLIRVIKRNVLFVSLIILLFLSLGIVLYNRKLTSETTTYKKTLIVSSRLISNYFVSNLVNSLDTKNSITLSEQINLSPIFSAKIDKIKAETITNPDNTSQVSIDMVVIGRKAIQIVSKSIVTYIQNNPYVKKQFDLESEKNTKLLRIIDSSIRYIHRNKSQGEVIIKGDQFDIKSSNFELVYLYQKKAEVEKNIVESQQIQVLSDGIPEEVNKKFSLVSILLLNMLIGVVVSFSFLYIGYIYRKLRSINI